MGFCRQEYWSGLPFPSPGDLPTTGIEPGSPELQADPLRSQPPEVPQVNSSGHPHYLWKEKKEPQRSSLPVYLKTTCMFYINE